MVIFILDCVGEKNQQLIVFPGIFSIKFHVQTDYFPVLQHWKLGPKHKNQNHSKDFSYGSFSPAKVHNQRCSSFFSLLGIYMDSEKGKPSRDDLLPVLRVYDQPRGTALMFYEVLPMENAKIRG